MRMRVVVQPTLVRLMKKFGVVFQKETGEEWLASCPTCGRERHCYVNVRKGVWHCKSCGGKGGPRSFLDRTWKDCEKALQKGGSRVLAPLAADRGLDSGAFSGLGIGLNFHNRPTRIEYTFPHFDGGGSVCDLRCYTLGRTIVSCPGGTTSIFNLPELLAADPDRVFICEGEWDTIALRHLLLRSKLSIPKTVAVGVPGAASFKEHWPEYFNGKDVVLCYDNDSAGEQGERRAWSMLQDSVNTLQAVHWEPNQPPGYDIRDFVTAGREFEELQVLLRPKPRTSAAGLKFQVIEPTGKAASASAVVRTFKKWLYMESSDVLDVVFGSILANRLSGEPLWVFIVAPPGGSKSEILMSLEDATSIETTTSFTTHALISGAQGPGGEDPSWLPHLDGKVLVIKDFTPILQLNHIARDEIFGMLRDAYDQKTSKAYGTGIKRSYRSKFGILAGVTQDIHRFHTVHTSLGERFIRYDLPDDDETKRILRALSNRGNEDQMRKDLRAVSASTLSREMPVEIPGYSKKIEMRLVYLARYCALLRGVVARDRYSGDLLYRPRAEIATRLAKQLSSLGAGIAIWREEQQITEEIYRILVRVARSSIPDRVDLLVECLWGTTLKEEDSITRQDIVDKTALPGATVFRMLEDLALLKIIIHMGGSNAKVYRWGLSNEVRKWIEDSQVFAPRAE